MELQEIERCAMHNEPLPDGLGQPDPLVTVSELG